MNAFEIFEALTDVDDAQLLEADEKGPVKKPRRWHGLVAACLALVLLTTAFLGTTALNQDTTMRYTIRYRENRVTYLCKVSAHRVGKLPQYRPGWLPEGYVYTQEFSFGENERTMTYRNTQAHMEYMAFSYVRITDTYKSDLYTLPMGSYQRTEVTVNGLPGQLYQYTDLRTGGELIWLDEENCLLLRISFSTEDPTDILKMANSIQLKEE